MYPVVTLAFKGLMGQLDCLSVESRPPADVYLVTLIWPWPLPHDLDSRPWPSILKFLGLHDNRKRTDTQQHWQMQSNVLPRQIREWLIEKMAINDALPLEASCSDGVVSGKATEDLRFTLPVVFKALILIVQELNVSVIFNWPKMDLNGQIATLNF